MFEKDKRPEGHIFGEGDIKPIFQDADSKEAMKMILQMNSDILSINSKIAGMLTAVQFVAKEGK